MSFRPKTFAEALEKQRQRPPKKRKPMRPVSEKRKPELARYLRLRKEYLKLVTLCERCSVKRSTDLHHKAGRGKLLCDMTHWAALCRACHDWIHFENPRQAREDGWIIDPHKIK